mmetsp:Transcript_12972/g.24046  ORF Transcript_12972/g.24046 Transcript_12972/m.24046 type:complete len:282 (+) Transcript_12972:744-1589(+)
MAAHWFDDATAHTLPPCVAACRPHQGLHLGREQSASSSSSWVKKRRATRGRAEVLDSHPPVHCSAWVFGNNGTGIVATSSHGLACGVVAPREHGRVLKRPHAQLPHRLALVSCTFNVEGFEVRRVLAERGVVVAKGHVPAVSHHVKHLQAGEGLAQEREQVHEVGLLEGPQERGRRRGRRPSGAAVAPATSFLGVPRGGGRGSSGACVGSHGAGKRAHHGPSLGGSRTREQRHQRTWFWCGRKGKSRQRRGAVGAAAVARLLVMLVGAGGGGGKRRKRKRR